MPKCTLINMIAAPWSHEQAACVIVRRLNGHANGPDTRPRPTTESSGVLSWAYPSVGGTPPRPGSASKTRHGKHSMVAAYGTADTAPSIHYMAAGFSLAAVAVHGISGGWSVAGGMVSDGTAVSNVAVPLYLTEALKGCSQHPCWCVLQTNICPCRHRRSNNCKFWTNCCSCHTSIGPVRQYTQRLCA